jgi:hypothetical protein
MITIFGTCFTFPASYTKEVNPTSDDYNSEEEAREWLERALSYLGFDREEIVEDMFSEEYQCGVHKLPENEDGEHVFCVGLVHSSLDQEYCCASTENFQKIMKFYNDVQLYMKFTDNIENINHPESRFGLIHDY